MAVQNMRIMIRRDTEANWNINGDNTLLEGEIGYELDTRKMKIGYQSKAYAELPYFAGGIVDIHPDGGLKLDSAGLLFVDNDVVIGELPANTTIKQYVDGLIQGEGATRAQEDQLLSNRIDEVNVSLDNLNTREVSLVNAENQNTFVTKALSLGFSVDVSELQTQEDANLLTLDLLNGLTTSVNDLNQDVVLLTSSVSSNSASIQTLENDVAGLTSSVNSLNQDVVILSSSVSSNGSSIQDLDDKFGTLSITGPTGGVFASDNVTDFVSDLLFRSASGDMGGLSMKAYVDAATSSLNADIDEIYDKSDGSGLIADLGAQINALDGRLIIVEGKVGALENKFDTNGNLTANTIGTHQGDVVDASGDIIVDVANANFNGNVTGNVTGITVGSHYGHVYADENGANPGLIINGDTQDVTCASVVTSGAVGIGGTLQVAQAAAFANTVEVEELLHAKKDLIADGAGAIGGGLQVGEQVAARSAALNDFDPAIHTPGDVYPFMAVKDEDVVTKKFYMETGPGRVSVNRHAISSIDSNGSDGFTWNAAVEDTILDGTIVYDQGRGAVYIRLKDNVFDGYAQISA